MPELFWWDDPKSLITKENWKQFIPRGSFDVVYLNNLARFILYLGILSWFYFQKTEIIYLTVIGLLITVFLYKKYLSSTNNNDNKINNDSNINTNVCETRKNGRKDLNPQLISSPTCERIKKSEEIPDDYQGLKEVVKIDPRFQIPEELFDSEQGKIDLKTMDDFKYISKSIETNGLPNDNQPNMGVVPTFDLRPGSTQNDNFDSSQSLLLKIGGPELEAKGNHLGSMPASINSVLQDAFKIGDRLGDNIRRDPDVHSSTIDLSKTPNNMVCGPCKFNVKNSCQMATPNNPFGNVLPTDNVGNPGRGPSCLDRDDTDNKWTLSASPFAGSTGSLGTQGQGLFRNVDDVWDRNNGQMSYNTLPSTTIPNDRDSYQKWLYHTPYVCKDGDMEACYAIDELQTRKAGQILAL